MPDFICVPGLKFAIRCTGMGNSELLYLWAMDNAQGVKVRFIDLG